MFAARPSIWQRISPQIPIDTTTGTPTPALGHGSAHQGVGQGTCELYLPRAPPPSRGMAQLGTCPRATVVTDCCGAETDFLSQIPRT